MTPVVSTSRSVGDIRLVASPRCISAPSRNDPTTLTNNVPYGKAVPSTRGAPSAIRYLAPVPTAPPRQIHKKRDMAPAYRVSTFSWTFFTPHLRGGTDHRAEGGGRPRSLAGRRGARRPKNYSQSYI